MGQTAAGGVGGPEPGLLPRGYQPGDFLPPTPQKLASPARLCDDDGSWPGGLDAKAPPPRRSAAPASPGAWSGSHQGPKCLATGGSPLPPPPPIPRAPSGPGDEGGDRQRPSSGLPSFPVDMDGAHSPYSSSYGRRGAGDICAGADAMGYGGRGYANDFSAQLDGVAACGNSGLMGRVDSFASSVNGGGSAAAGGCVDGSRRGAFDGYAGPYTGAGIADGFDARVGSRMDSFASESGYAPSNAGTVMGAGRHGRWEDPVRRTGSTGTAGSANSSSSAWEEGSIVEAYSATSGMWYPARVMQAQPGDEEDILTVLFYVEEEPKQKSMLRRDPMLAPLGRHTAGILPPGFATKASQSRAGQLVYWDATTGMRYASTELAWQVHFERLMARPAAGCETVAAVRACAPSTMPPSPSTMPPSPQAAGPRPMSLAELQASAPAFPQGAPSEASDASYDLTVSGKIALPSFGDAMGSQAAYLRFEGKPGAEVAAAAAQADARLMPANTAGYHVPMRGAAPRRPAPPPRNPALQTWQEDPFSEWRR